MSSRYPLTWDFVRDDLWDRSLSSLFTRFPSLSPTGAAWPTPGEITRWEIRSEITESPDAYHFKLEVPGLSKDQIKVDLHENTLTISGERKEERKDEQRRKVVSEMIYGAFGRSFTLPSRVDPEKVSAKYENGILWVDVQKSTPTTARQINVR